MRLWISIFYLLPFFAIANPIALSDSKAVESKTSTVVFPLIDYGYSNNLSNGTDYATFETEAFGFTLTSELPETVRRKSGHYRILGVGAQWAKDSFEVGAVVRQRQTPGKRLDFDEWAASAETHFSPSLRAGLNCLALRQEGIDSDLCSAVLRHVTDDFEARLSLGYLDGRDIPDSSGALRALEMSYQWGDQTQITAKWSWSSLQARQAFWTNRSMSTSLDLLHDVGEKWRVGGKISHSQIRHAAPFGLDVEGIVYSLGAPLNSNTTATTTRLLRRLLPGVNLQLQLTDQKNWGISPLLAGDSRAWQLGLVYGH